MNRNDVVALKRTSAMALLLAGASAAISAAARQEPPELIYSGNDLVPGETHSGVLEASHPQMGDGTHADCFQLRPSAGTEYTITLRSREFDSFLLVGVGTCEDVLVQFENDDFEEDSFDARIVFAAEYDLYSVYVNTYEPGATGAYTLSVEHRLLPLPPVGVGQ